jgi:hypothetical protein
MHAGASLQRWMLTGGVSRYAIEVVVQRWGQNLGSLLQ